MAKARTKAAKTKAKRGRPRKEGNREPNGRLSRSRVEPIDRLALETRMKQMGISKDMAKDQKAGSFIGYLNLIGPRDGLSDAQYDGAQAYLKLRGAYLRALNSPEAVYDPEALSPASDPDAYADWCNRTCEQYEAARKAIQTEQNYCRENLWAALHLVVIEDHRLHGMIGATRMLCNVLARHFKIPGENCRAA